MTMEQQIDSRVIADVDPLVNPRDFRRNPDIENFYRFVHDNQLRLEAYVLLKAMVAPKLKKRASSSRKKVLH